MKIVEIRSAINKAENDIEKIMDDFRRHIGLNIDSVEVQTLLDKKTSTFPVIKINLGLSKLPEKTYN